MKVFLVDCYHDHSSHRLYLNTRDTAGIQHLLCFNEPKRSFYVVIKEARQGASDLQGWLLSVINTLVGYQSGAGVTDTVMSFIYPRSDIFVPQRRVLKVTVKSQLFNRAFYGFKEKRFADVECVIGRDGSCIEELVVGRQLKGWLDFNHRDHSVREIPQECLFEVERHFYELHGSASLQPGQALPAASSSLADDAFDVQQVPALPFIAIHQYRDNPPLFAIYDDEAGVITSEGHTVADVNRYVTECNPAFLLVHDLDKLADGLLFKQRLLAKPRSQFVNQVIVDTYWWSKDLLPMHKDYSLWGLAESYRWLDARQPAPRKLCQIIVKLARLMGVLDLITQLALDIGQPCSHALTKINRVEWLLLHRFAAAGCIPPDKPTEKALASFKAGLVLEPERGIYDTYTLLLDFRSLYPSIIVEHGLCFSILGNILPPLMQELIETRKHLAPLEPGNSQIRIRRSVLKLLANSTYGGLAYAWSRFYSLSLAERITAFGRQHLSQLVTFIHDNHPPCQVIYGDTDSVMVSTHRFEPPLSIEACRALANDIVDAVNRQYDYMELEFEKLFTRLVLYAKKKYAASSAVFGEMDGINLDTGEQEPLYNASNVTFKGLDMVKRGFAPVGTKLCETLILNTVNAGKQTSEADMLAAYALVNHTITHLLRDELSWEELLLVRKLSKKPEDYDDTAGLYHVIAARSASHARRFNAGDFVNYVMTTPPRTTPRLYPLPLVPGGPEPDRIWYRDHVLPMVDRILAIYPGHSMRRLSDYLRGQDPASKKIDIRTLVRSTRVDHPLRSATAPAGDTIICTMCKVSNLVSGYHNLEQDAISRPPASSPHHRHLSAALLHGIAPATKFNCSNCKNRLKLSGKAAITQRLARLLLLYDCEVCQLVVGQHLSKL